MAGSFRLSASHQALLETAHAGVVDPSALRSLGLGALGMRVPSMRTKRMTDPWGAA
jgi:hypothetical protein